MATRHCAQRDPLSSAAALGHAASGSDGSALSLRFDWDRPCQCPTKALNKNTPWSRLGDFTTDTE